MMNKTVLGASCAAILLAAAAATMASFGPEEAISPARLAYVNAPCKPDNAPAYLSSSGAFVPEQLEEAAFSSGADASALVRDFDLAVLGRAYFYAVNAEHPGELVAFAASVNDKTHPDYSIIVPKSSPVKDWRGLAGKTLGLEPASGHARNALAKILLEKHGLTGSARVQTAQLGDLGKSVDALYLREPQLSLAMATGKYRKMDSNMLVNGILDPWPQAYYVVTRNYLENDPASAKAAVRAVLEGVARAQSGAVAAKTLAECSKRSYGQELPILPAAYWWPQDFDFQGIQKQIDLYAKEGLISRSFDARTILLPAARR